MQVFLWYALKDRAYKWFSRRGENSYISIWGGAENNNLDVAVKVKDALFSYLQKAKAAKKVDGFQLRVKELIIPRGTLVAVVLLLVVSLAAWVVALRCWVRPR